MIYEPIQAFVPLFLVGIGLLAAGILLLGLLDQKKPKPGPTQVTARGGYLPLLIGRHRVGGSILWRGDRITRGVDAEQLNDYDEGNTGQGFTGAQRGIIPGDEKEEIDTFLERGMVAFNIGCAQSINQIYVDGKTILTAPVKKTTTGSGRPVSYVAPRDLVNNGSAKLRPYFGNSADYDRAQSTYKGVMDSMGFINLDENRNVPTWPNLVFVIFDRFYMGPQARWGRIEADITVLPIAQEELPVEFTFAAMSADLPDGGGGVNPMYAVWVLLTGKYPYGVGMPVSKIDKTSLNTVALALQSEGVFVNINTADGEKAGDLIQEIFDDCGIVISEVNGLMHFDLIRQGDPAITLDEDGLSPPIEEIEVNAEPFRPRSVEFQYLSNKIAFDQDTINVEQDGFSQYRGSKKRDKLDLKVITQDTIANKVAYRRAQEVFSLQYSVRFTTSRDGRILRPGQLINLPSFGGLRISKVEYDFNSPKVRVTAYTDPYLVPEIEYVDDDGGEKPPRPPFTCPDGTVPVVDPTKPFASVADYCPEITKPEVVNPPSPCANQDCAPPEPPGEDPVACCFGETGTCLELKPSVCATTVVDGVRGTPYPEGTNCQIIDCPTPQVGSCCVDGVCSDTTYPDCLANGGDFDPDNLCASPTNPSGRECEAPVLGICCGQGKTQECLESSTGVCPEGYTFVNTRTTCPTDDDEYCCTAHSDYGACCYCTADNKVDCFETDEDTCLKNGGLTDPVFTPGKSCCQLEDEDGGCANDCSQPKGPDLSPDLYVRPLVLPVQFDVRDDQNNSRVILLRSAFDKTFASNEVFYRLGSTGQGSSISGMSNPSIPGGNSISNIVIPPTQPRHQILYYGDISGTVFDNGHTPDLVTIEGSAGKLGVQGWFSGNQPLLYRNSSQILYVRSAVSFGAGDFNGTFKGILMGRSNSLFPKGCFISAGSTDYGSIVDGDLIAYSPLNFSFNNVTGGIIDRLDSFSNQNAFLVPLGGTNILSATYNSGFQPGALSFESVPCNSTEDCSSQQDGGAGFELVDTVTDGAISDGVYRDFAKEDLVRIPFVRAGSPTSSPYNSSSRLRQSTGSVSHNLTSDALTVANTRLSIMPGIWKVAESAGNVSGLTTSNNPVKSYDNTLIEKYWSDLVVEVGLPRFAPQQPVPDESGYGVKTGNIGDIKTYGSGTAGGDPSTVRYSITFWQSYIPLLFPNLGGFPVLSVGGFGPVNFLALKTKTGTINSTASGSFFETFTPTELRNAYDSKFGPTYVDNSALLKLFNTTRATAEGVSTGATPVLFNNYISIVLQDQEVRRSVAFIGPTDASLNSLIGHIDPCQPWTDNQFEGTRSLQAIGPDNEIITKAVSHWDSTLTAVYGKGYKLT